MNNGKPKIKKIVDIEYGDNAGVVYIHCNGGKEYFYDTFCYDLDVGDEVDVSGMHEMP